METADFFFRVREKFRLHVAAEALEAYGCEHAFRCAAAAENHMDAAALDATVDGRYHITVGDETDAGAGCASFADDAFMSFAVEDNDAEIRDFSVHGFGHAGQVFGDRCIDVDAAFGSRADANFLHIHIRCMEQATFRCDS